MAVATGLFIPDVCTIMFVANLFVTLGRSGHSVTSSHIKEKGGFLRPAGTMSASPDFVRTATFQFAEFLTEIATEGIRLGYTIPELVDLFTDIWIALERRLARRQEPFESLPHPA